MAHPTHAVHVPHFAFPFQIKGPSVAYTDQDTLDEIANCVAVICLIPQGWFAEDPEFGIPELTFDLQPVGSDDLIPEILQQEPRADLLIREAPDEFDNLIAHIIIAVKRRGGANA